MINVIRMDAQSDDVAIDTLRVFDTQTPLRDLYNYVKGSAVGIAEKYPKALVDMGEFKNLPHASVYVDDIIKHQVFAEFEW